MKNNPLENRWSWLIALAVNYGIGEEQDVFEELSADPRLAHAVGSIGWGTVMSTPVGRLGSLRVELESKYYDAPAQPLQRACL